MNNVCLNLVKNKKLFFLILSSISLFAFNFKSNNKKNNSNNNNPSVNIMNDFNVSLKKYDLGAFSHVEYDTGWKNFGSDSNIGNYIKNYNTFQLPIYLKNLYWITWFDGSGDAKFFQFLVNDNFSTKDFLVNNKVTTYEYYGEGTDLAGYYQQYLIISFKLVDNVICFKEYGYIYSGWCVQVVSSEISESISKDDHIVFYNR